MLTGPHPASKIGYDSSVVIFLSMVLKTIHIYAYAYTYTYIHISKEHMNDDRKSAKGYVSFFTAVIKP